MMEDKFLHMKDGTKRFIKAGDELADAGIDPDDVLEVEFIHAIPIKFLRETYGP